MAVAFDAATGANPFATSASFSHTTSGSNRLLLVGIVFNNDPGSTPTATYNGVSMTLIASRADTMWAYVWALEDPASGANTVAISWTNTRATAIGAISFKDATGTPKYNHVITESDGDESIDISTDHSSDMVAVIAVQPGSGTPLGSPPGTERLSQGGSFGGQTLQISTAPGTGSPVTMAYTSVGTSTFLTGVNVVGPPSAFVPYPNPISGRSGPFHKVQL